MTIRRPALLALFLPILTTPAFADAPILVEEFAGIGRVAEPVTLGIPFAPGALDAATPLAVTDDSGQPVDAQFAVMSRHRDGSVRWLKTDFAADVDANRTSRYTLATGTVHAPATELGVVERAGEIEVTTGPLRFTVSRTTFALLDRAWLDLDGDRAYEPDEQIVSPGSSIRVRANGQSFVAGVPDELVIEEQGPMKVVLRASGLHTDAGGGFLLKYETRIYAYAGQPFIEFHHVYANGQSLDSLGDSMDLSATETIDDYSLNLTLNLEGAKTVRFGGDDGEETSFALGAGQVAQIHQLDRATTATPLTYEIREGATLRGSGSRAAGWGSISDDRWGVLVSSRYFWEKYPKALSLADDGTVSFQPAPTEEFLWAGMGTADRILLSFHDTASAGDAQKLAMSRSKNPLQPRTSARQFRRSGAFYALRSSSTPLYPAMDDYLEQTTANHLANRDNLQLYGNFNFGDTIRDEYAAFADPDESDWGNNYYDAVLTAARLFAQSGDPRQLDVMVPMAWHFMETDCFNTYDPNDWLNGFCAPYGSFHRAIGHIDQHYGEGIWYYYYLTGDERAREVGLRAARSIAGPQWWANQNPNARNAYQRGSSCLEAYKATGDETFLDHARHLLVDKIASTQDGFGMLGAEVEEGGLRIEGEQTFMMALYSDTLWKFIQELAPGSPERASLSDQVARLADFFNVYARKSPGVEDYWNWWSAPPSNAAPVPFPAGGNPDATVYWNGRCLITGTYAYAYDLTGLEQYRSLAVASMQSLWNGEAFGQEFWGKESCQAMKSLIHAAAILDQTPTPVLLGDFEAHVERDRLRVAWSVESEGALPAFRLALAERGRERELTFHTLGDGRFRAEASMPLEDATVRLYAKSAGPWELLHSKDLTPSDGGLRSQLTGVHPNPFNPRGVVRLRVERSERVRVTVLDARGRHVATLADGVLGAGEHQLVWDGVDGRGRSVASGLYFASLQTETARDVRKMTLVR